MAESRCSILLIDNGAHALLPTSNRAEEVHTSRKRGQKSEENDDDLCEGKDMEILKVLKPLYISMACFVLHWTGKDTWFSKKRCYFDGFTVHCCFMLCLGWFWFAASFIGYQNNAGFGAWLIRHVLNQIFCIQIACGITGNVYQRHKHIIHFYALWNRYKIKYGGASYDYMRKRVLVWVILIDVVLLCFTVFDTVIIFIAGYEVEVHPVSTTLEKLFPNVRSSYFIIAVLLALNYSTIAWLQIIIFITQVNYLLKLEFKELTKQFANEVQLIEEKQAIESSENRSLKNNVTAENLCDVTELDMLEIYRKRHLQLCRLVNHFDDASSIFIILLYFLNIPLTVFSVYGMMGFGRSSENAIMTWIYVEVVAYFIIMVLVITISSARLAAAAREPKGILHTVDLLKCSPQQGHSVQVFLQKVSSDHTGLTIWKFINIDKGVLITLLSIIITYVALVVKFSLAMGSADSVQQLTAEDCNCINVTSTVNSTIFA